MRKLLVSLVVLMVSLFLFGSVAMAQDAAVTIDFWQTDSQIKVDAMAKVIEAFQAANPNITVVQTVVPYTDYQTKIAASVPAGTGPDVAMIYFGWAPLWSKSGFIVPLPADLSASLDSDFVPFAQVTKIDDAQYAVPTSIRNFALFYNVDLLAEAGWDAPPATWEEFAQAAKDCTKTDANGNITQAGYYLGWGDDGWNWFRPLVQAYGGQAFSDDARTTLWNQGGAVDAWNYMLAFTSEVKSSVPDFYEGEYDAFAAGLTCMSPQLTYAVGALKTGAAPDLNWAVAPMPAGPEGSFTTGSSWPLSITAKAATDAAKNDAAIKFVTFMASAEGQEIYNDITGELPARLDMVDLPKYTDDPILAPFIAQLPQTTGVFWVDELAERQCAIDMYDSVVVGGADPTEALNAGTACDQALRDAFFAE